MLLTIDVGNTNMVFSLFDGDVLYCESRADTVPSRMPDQYAVLLIQMLSLYGKKPSDISGGIISSVVPQVTEELKLAVERLCGVTVIVVGPGLKTGLNIKTDSPSSLGSDICCGGVAAKNLYTCPCIFIDFGTVTKIMVLDKYGALIGGVFHPGIKVCYEAFSKSTTTLPLLTASIPGELIGRCSEECMNSGVIYGAASMIDGIVEKIMKTMGKCSIVATGGYAPLISNYTECDMILHPYLISEGMRIIYNKNKPI